METIASKDFTVRVDEDQPRLDVETLGVSLPLTSFCLEHGIQVGEQSNFHKSPGHFQGHNGAPPQLFAQVAFPPSHIGLDLTWLEKGLRPAGFFSAYHLWIKPLSLSVQEVCVKKKI